MKKILLSIILSILAFASSKEVTILNQKITKDSIIFVYDVPDTKFNILKEKQKFYKNLLTKMECKNKNARLLMKNTNVIFDYRKHSNNNDKVVFTIKKGSCSKLK